MSCVCLGDIFFLLGHEEGVFWTGCFSDGDVRGHTQTELGEGSREVVWLYLRLLESTESSAHGYLLVKTHTHPHTRARGHKRAHSRSYGKDYILREELESLQRDGALTRLSVCFSRDDAARLG